MIVLENVYVQQTISLIRQRSSTSGANMYKNYKNDGQFNETFMQYVW